MASRPILSFTLPQDVALVTADGDLEPGPARSSTWVSTTPVSTDKAESLASTSAGQRGRSR